MAYYQELYLSHLYDIARALRVTSLDMIYRRGGGHPGGSFSAAELVTALYFHKLRIDPHHPLTPDRDRFILSKGHASPLLYAALAKRGFFPETDLERWGQLDCHLQGHPERGKTPGVEMTSGLLGHGISVGVGLALAAKLNQQTYRTYVMVGDGECQGGIIWEGAMAAGKFRVANLTVIVDYNDVQLDGFVHDIMPLEPFVDKWRAFNLHVLEIDGHNMRQILDALDTVEQIHDRPTVIVAHTTKGKGVSFMENNAAWHGIAPNAEQYERARQELMSL